jgi:hypothetical protein
LIRDLQTNLWRLNLESQTKEQIATGVLRVVSSPLSEMALSASDDDGTGTSALLQVRATDTLPLPLPPNRSTMITPLLGIDSAECGERSSKKSRKRVLASYSTWTRRMPHLPSKSILKLNPFAALASASERNALRLWVANRKIIRLD